MIIAHRLLTNVYMFSILLVVSIGSHVQAQRFWSPRHVVLDTYTEPVPFLCDGEVLLAYELHITNMDRLTISLETVDIFDDEIPAPTETYSGELLAGNLNRISAAGQPEDVRHVSGGQRAVLHVLLRLAGSDELPSVLTHRVVYSFLKPDGSEVEAVATGGTIRVARENEALIIGAPLGGVWLAGRGVSTGLSGHRGGAIRPQDGIPYQKARYAIDFTGFDTAGRAFTGQRWRNENWIGYGSQVLAVADGRVKMVRDGVPDSRPFDPEVLQGLTGETLGGNCVVLDLGNDIFAFYGHLQPGSLLIREGDTVHKGQVLGLVGNSGNSTAPHLHFQINRAIPIRGEAVPYVFESYEYLGEAERGWLFQNHISELFEKDFTKYIGRIGGGKKQSGREVLPAIAVTDSIRSSILRGMRGANRAAIPDWVRALRDGGEIRLNEMPGSNAVIRL